MRSSREKNLFYCVINQVYPILLKLQTEEVAEKREREKIQLLMCFLFCLLIRGAFVGGKYMP